MQAALGKTLKKITTASAVAVVAGLFAFGTPSASAATATAAPAAAPARAGLPRFGQSGDAVKALQQALVAKGFTLVGGVDGVFSPRTRATLRNFQSVVGFRATGRLDLRTARLLGLIPANVAATSATVPAPTTTAPAPTTTAPAPMTTAPATTVAPTTVPAPTAAPIAWSVEMLPMFGARGEVVAALQNALIGAGVEVFGGADGIFGNATKTAVSKFQTARNLAATGALDAATAIELGLLPRPVLAVTIPVFPVRPACYFIDTWMEPRGNNRKHEGVDIIANRGQEVLAVADGTITKIYTADTAKLSGNAVRLTMGDGTYFFYAHLDTFAPGIAVGTKVAAGQVIGTVGSTGATTPHLHFEVHPQGGAAVNPYPIVKAVDACKK
jgi:murein DD-endopeptidase MepM/ murein hydrolase activator NlpD